jgi:hypothetical protein
MIRIRRHRERTLRQWLGFCLVLLLTVAPPLNLAGFELSLPSHGEAGVHAGHDHHGHDHSNLAHHSSGNACLQCLVMGGMSLAGAAVLPQPAPHIHAVAARWAPTDLAWDSRDPGALGCRGPPVRMTA